MGRAMGCGSSKSANVKQTYREYYKEQSTCISYVSSRGEPDGEDDKQEKDEWGTSTSNSSNSGLFETEVEKVVSVDQKWPENHSMNRSKVAKS